jgi:hypothetical protein
MFNALKYIRSLEAAGLPREQAEAQVQLVIAAIEDEVATKTDLSEFRSESKAEFGELRAEFAEFRAETRAEFSGVRAEMRTEFASVRSEMRAEFANVRSEMRTEFANVTSEFAKLRGETSEMKAELVFKLSALFVGFNTIGFGALGVLIAFLAHK